MLTKGNSVIHCSLAHSYICDFFEIGFFRKQPQFTEKIILGIVELGKQIRNAPNRHKINTNHIALQSLSNLRLDFKNFILDFRIEY